MNKIIFLAVTISFNLFASEPGAVQFGRVVELKGEGFISYKGKTHEIRKGDIIEAGSDIVIEHQGLVIFTDNADHRFHLGNSSSASIGKNSIELRSGDLWFQSLNKNDDYKIQTANAIINYQGGEAIITYDSMKGKTQLMVINGMMKFSNLRATELNLSVAEGQFSFVDNTYDEGAPRDPTPVGGKTFGELTALFKGVSPMDKNSVAIFKNNEKEEHGNVEAARSIASASEKTVEKAEEKVNIDSKIMEEYKNSLLNKSTSKKAAKAVKVVAKKATKAPETKSSQLVVHIYGQTSVAKSRAPASVLEEAVPSEVAPISAPVPATPYSKDYKNQYKESDKLINELQKL